MEAVLPAVALKPFARILQCLAKIGEDLYIQPRPNKLLLATVNASRSACAHYALRMGFFERYSVGSQAGASGSTGVAASSCHVLLKPLLNIFRAKNTVDNVESCRIRLQCNGNEDRLVIQLQCKYGVLKTHKLHFELCDPLAAVYSKNAARHKWTISSKITHDWLNHFHSRLEEIAMRCGADWIALRSFTEAVAADEDDHLANRTLQTELQIDIEDFDKYEVANDTSVIFDLKNFKAILTFADAMGQPVSAFFDQAGSPVIFTVTQAPDLYVFDLVIATTIPFDEDAEEEDARARQSQQNQTTPVHEGTQAAQGGPRTAAATPRSSAPLSHAEARKQNTIGDVEPVQRQRIPILRRDQEDDDSRQDRFDQTSNPALDTGPGADDDDDEELPPSPPRKGPAMLELMAELRNSRRREAELRQMAIASPPGTTTTHVSNSFPDDGQRPAPGAFQKPAGLPSLAAQQNRGRRSRELGNLPLDDDDNEILEPTPPVKKARSFFKR
ncbi:Rad9-domain-containing protein [Fimicolochytrium jonesii]|uniref:Rad9-domain-containing protein n=1 Tax=Fimicolochytrium jonesii TaxID=1396493 RepID=UPI0022FE78A7|nr:Rad9-domain-containing protein [Fimicolochytrium jonesii]KAI8818965.1 Rad9-domain-containing protein [Fimicolochytrium jonesii]